MEGKDLLKDGDLLVDGYNDCIVGVAVVVVDGMLVRRVIYNAEAMVKQLAKEYAGSVINPDDNALDIALEFLEFNTFNSYLGDKTPIYLGGVG
jgi:hypothetical protein